MTHVRTSTPVIANLSRRAVLAGSVAGGLVLAMRLPQSALAQTQKFAGEGMPNGLRDDPRIFVAIAEDGTVTVTCHRSDMGQGVRTSWPMVIADELDADWARIRVAQAWGDEQHFGNQDTDGSRSMRHHFAALRRIGAAVRQMLEAAAAAQWNVPVDQVAAQNHEVVHAASNRRLGYGALAKAAAGMAVPTGSALRLKDPSKFRYIGRDDIGLLDNMDITTGKAVYGIDPRLPDMLYAVVARPPVLGGRLASLDGTEAMKVKGVVKIVPIEPSPIPSSFEPVGGVAVVATNTWAAIKGREALKITWDDGQHGNYSSDAYKAQLEAAARQPGKVVRNTGDVDAAMRTAVRKVEAEYYLPHLAHATMEPPAAVVRAGSDSCEAWGCVQSPQAARTSLAKRLGLPEDKVRVNVTLLGGGFGRKSKADFMTEAAILSKAMDGKPVKVTWTRDDDLQNDFFHTVSVERIEAGLDASGKPVAWLHRTVAPTLFALFQPDPRHETPPELAMGAVDNPLAIPNMRVENPEAIAHTRIGWFRSVSNIPHGFAVQSFVAELAAATNKDHKAFLLELLGPDRRIDPAAMSDEWNYGEDPALYPYETSRLRAVIEAVTQAAGWGRSMPNGSGLGLAAHRSFASYTAAVVEVKVGDRGAITIPKVDIAIDCGPVINPERVRAQLEGAVIQGIGVAMLGEISFKNGRSQQTNFDGFELIRMDAAPREVKVHIVPSSDWNRPLGGVGEPGVPPVPPALTNAIFAATGKRIRRLPIRDQVGA